MNKRNIIITVIVLLVIVLAVAATSKKKMTQESTAAQQADTTAVSAQGSTAAGTKSSTTASTTLSRKDALELYQDRIIRITNDCFADSHTYFSNLMKGEKIMLDNDSDKAHTVVFAGASYAISAHGYRTAILQNDGVVSSTCDPKTNVTTLVVTPPAK